LRPRDFKSLGGENSIQLLLTEADCRLGQADINSEACQAAALAQVKRATAI